MKKLKTLQEQSMNIYLKYRSNLISLDEYLKQIKPLDIEIDKIVTAIFKKEKDSIK